MAVSHHSVGGVGKANGEDLPTEASTGGPTDNTP